MLEQLPATSATFAVKHTTEVHHHAQNLARWSQEYEQTSAGCFEGRVREFQDSELQAFEEFANRSTAQYCQAWDGGIWFGLPTDPDAQNVCYMGHPLERDHLMIANGRVQFDLRVPAGVGLYGIVISRSDFEHRLRQHEGKDSIGSVEDLVAQQPQLVRIPALQRHRLAALLREAMHNLQSHPEILRHSSSVSSLRTALMTVLIGAWRPAQPQSEPSMRRRRRLDLVHRARALVLNEPAAHLTVEQLCQALFVTRRTLQNCFQDVLGMSPGAYLRTVRLNRVRQDLLQAEPGHTVVDVAARWGFWHMGHFAHDYRALFAETPSQTMRRAGAKMNVMAETPDSFAASHGESIRVPRQPSLSVLAPYHGLSFEQNIYT